jgi:hypothetical protein
MSLLTPTSFKLPIEFGSSTAIDPKVVAEHNAKSTYSTQRSQNSIPEISGLTDAEFSAANLLNIQEDVQSLAIRTAAESNTSSSKASTLNKMTRFLNMV